MFSRSATKKPATFLTRLLLAGLLSLTALTPALAPKALAQKPDADPIAQIEAHQQALFKKIVPSVVFISQGQTMGSGFFVSEDGLILTNAHVVGRAESVEVVLRDGRRLKAKVLQRAGDDIDLALLQVPLTQTPALTLAGFSELQIGSWVAAIGHSAGGIWSFTTGMVSNIYTGELDEPVFQTQIPIRPGASGGPVFDRHGRVVGVITSGIKDSSAINFAIRTDTAVRIFEQLGNACECLTISAPAGVPIFVNQKMIGKGPRVVLPVQPGNFEVFAVIQGEMKRHNIKFPQTKAVSLE